MTDKADKSELLVLTGRAILLKALVKVNTDYAEEFPDLPRLSNYNHSRHETQYKNELNNQPINHIKHALAS